MKIRLPFMFILFVMAGMLLQAQGLLLRETAVIDSATSYFVVGPRTTVLGSDNNIHAFYVQWGTKDTIFHVQSTDDGQTWTGYDVVAVHPIPNITNNHPISTVAAAEDQAGKFHVVYTYRGAPYYNASTNYPPTHIGFSTNESGMWTWYADAINDSTILANEMSNISTNYIYDSYIYSQGGEEYFSGYDYAWFATKYHFLQSKRLTAGVWEPASALVTYDRGQIDKYSLGPARIFGDGANTLLGMYLNRNTGEINVLENDGSGWGTESLVGMVNDPGDGILHYSQLGVISGEPAYASLSRWTTGRTTSTLYNFKRANAVWSMDSVSVPGTMLYPQAMRDADTLFTLMLNLNLHEMVLAGQYPNGGFSYETVAMPDSLEYIYIDALEGKMGPVIYVKRNLGTGEYWLCSGVIEGRLPVAIGARPFNSLSVVAFPNPNNGEFFVQLQNNPAGYYTFILQDMTGKTLSSQQYFLQPNETVGNLFETYQAAKGVYLLQVSEESLKGTARIWIVKH